MQLSGAKLSGSNVGNYSVSYSALLGFTTGQYTVNNSGYSYPLSMYPGFSFSRSSSAYSLDGSKQYPSNTPRISSGGLLVEAASTNLITNSAMTSGTGWSFYNASAGSNVTAPDGTTTALQVHYTASNGAIYQSGIALTAGTVYTLSCWVQWVSGSTQFYLVANPGASTIVTATGTWTRYTSTFTATANANIGVNGDPSVAGQVLNVWGYQVEAASSASSYIPTTTAAVTRTADAATQTYTGTATSVTVTTPGLGAMTYPAAGVTNLLSSSRDYSVALWTGRSSGLTTVGPDLGPDGSLSATKFSWGSGNAIEGVFESTTGGIGMTASTTYTLSVWAKGSGLFSLGWFDDTASTSGKSSNFTATGTWTRYSFTFTTGSGITPSTTGVKVLQNEDVNAGTVSLWEAQLEVGSTMNGIVHTSGGSATFTPSSPFTLSAVPFLGQNIKSLLITGSSGTIVSLDFINNVYSTKSNYSYTTATSTPGFSFTNSTGGYSLDGSTRFGVNTAVGPTDLSNTTNWPDFTAGNNNRTGSQADPFGGTSATKLMPTSANSPGHHLVQQATSLSSTSTTFSIYAKAAGLGFLVLSGYSYNYVSFNLTTGAITDGASGLSGFTAVNVGNGWWRCSATGSGTWGGQFQFGAAPDASNAAFTGNGTDGILVCAPQFESGTVATPYSSTTGQSAPRVTSAGLLVEPSSTNWFWPSQTPPLVTATDRAGGATVAAASITAPDGTSTAQTITSDTSYGFHGMGLTVSTAGVTTITGSFYFKSNTNPFLKFRLNANDGNSCQAYFDTSGANATTFYNTGTITNNSFQLISLPNGWYRAILTCTLPNATTGPTLVVGFCNGFGNDYYTGSASDQIAVWGFQYELGTTTATSLIPTTTAAVTRAADVVSLTFSGTATSIVVTYTGGTASPATSSPLNLGASSGGAWVGQNIQSVAIS